MIPCIVKNPFPYSSPRLSVLNLESIFTVCIVEWIQESFAFLLKIPWEKFAQVLSRLLISRTLPKVLVRSRSGSKKVLWSLRDDPWNSIQFNWELEHQIQQLGANWVISVTICDLKCQNQTISRWKTSQNAEAEVRECLRASQLWLRDVFQASTPNQFQPELGRDVQDDLVLYGVQFFGEIQRQAGHVFFWGV